MRESQLYLRLLRDNPEFAKLWAAQVISLLGDWFNTVVLSALVATYSDGSGLAVSLFLIARFLPPLLVSPLAGVLVDRYNRQWLLVGSNLLRALIVPLFLLADSPDRLWLIYLVTVVQFVLSAIFEPGQSAIIPALVKRDYLIEANTLVSVTWSVMLAAGAVVGGVFAAIFGTQWALLADAVTFAVAGALILSIRYQPRQNPVIQASESDDTGFIQGLRYLRRTPEALAAIFPKGGNSLISPDTLLTIYATQIVVIGASGEVSLGILYSSFGVGALLGPMLTNRVNDGSVGRLRRLMLLGFAAVTLGFLLFGLAGSLLFVSVGICVRAMGGSINWTYSTVLIQKTVPDDKLGRVFAMDMAWFQLAMVLSTLGQGALIDLIGSQNAPAVALLMTGISVGPLIFWAWVVHRLEAPSTAPHST